MRKILALVAALAMLASLPLHADTVEVRGVQLPTRVQLGDHEVVLNGHGIRQRLMFRVYVGSLYLPERSNDVQSILAMDGPKRIQMNLLRNIDQETLAEAMTDGFHNNLSEGELRRLQPQIQQFAGMLAEGRNGDEVRLDLLPGVGTRVVHQGQEMGVIEGDEFHSAVLRLWLGDHPADDSLKQGMLGL